MKRIFFLFLIMTSMTVVAQESIPQDTTLYLNGRKIIIKEHDGKIKVKRHIDGGVETVEGPLPIVITVNGSAAPCRPRNAKLVQKYKHAKTVTEKQQGNLDYTDLYDKRDYLNLVEWSVADVNGDLAQCGLSGSPTKVKAIQNIVFQAKESKTISGSDRDVEDLIVELLANHTIG